MTQGKGGDKMNIKLARFATGQIIMLMLITAVMGEAEASKLHQEDGILSNHSAEYVRTLNRNTSTDPDAAFYNPAGLAFIKNNGFYFSFSSQTLYVKKSHTLDFYGLKEGNEENDIFTPYHKQPWFKNSLPDKYKAELTAPILPGFDVIWKLDNWAFFLDIAVMQAAIDMTYDNGIATLDWGNILGNAATFPEDTHLIQYTRKAKVVRNEMYLGLTGGAAYELLSWLSLGGGVRLIYATGNMKIEVNNTNFLMQENATAQYSMEEFEDWLIDTDSSGIGYGLILSTHIRPKSILTGLDFTIRAEYYPPMKLKKKSKSLEAPWKIEGSGNLDIFKDGKANPGFNNGAGYAAGNGSSTLKITYPSTLNLGLSYILFNKIKLNTSAQLSFRQNRDLDGREKDYNFGYQAGGGIEFFLTPAVTLSTGYLYNNFGIKPEKRDEADPLLSSHSIGAGAGFKIADNLDINIGAFYQIYVPATVYEKTYVNSFGNESWSYLRKEMDEKRFSIGIGITYKIFTKKDKKKKEAEQAEDKKENNQKTKKR